MPVWTGIKSSTQWPIGGAVLAMIVWAVIRRREGFRICLLLASIVGIGLGLSVASAIHRAQTGRPPVPGLIMVLAPIVCSVLYVRAARAEQGGDKYRENLEQEFEAIKAMPPEDARKALEAKVVEAEKLVEDFEKREPSLRRKATILIVLGLVVTAVTLPLSIWPEPKPVSIILDASILVFCAFLARQVCETAARLIPDRRPRCPNRSASSTNCS